MKGQTGRVRQQLPEGLEASAVAPGGVPHQGQDAAALLPARHRGRHQAAREDQEPLPWLGGKGREADAGRGGVATTTGPRRRPRRTRRTPRRTPRPPPRRRGGGKRKKRKAACAPSTTATTASATFARSSRSTGRNAAVGGGGDAPMEGARPARACAPAAALERTSPPRRCAERRATLLLIMRWFAFQSFQSPRRASPRRRLADSDGEVLAHRLLVDALHDARWPSRAPPRCSFPCRLRAG